MVFLPQGWLRGIPSHQREKKTYFFSHRTREKTEQFFTANLKPEANYRRQKDT